MANLERLNQEIQNTYDIQRRQDRREVIKAYDVKLRILNDAKRQIEEGNLDVPDYEIENIIRNASKAKTQAYVGLRESKKLKDYNANLSLYSRAQYVKENLPPVKIFPEEIASRKGQSLSQIQAKEFKNVVKREKQAEEIGKKSLELAQQKVNIAVRELLKRKEQEKLTPKQKIQLASYEQVFGKKSLEQNKNIFEKPQYKKEFSKSTELNPLKVSFALKKPETADLEIDRTIYLNPARFLIGISTGVITTAKVIKNPKLFIDGVKNAISDPKGTIKATAYGFASDPFEFTGEGAVYGKIISLSGKGLKFTNTKIGELKTKISENTTKLEKTKSIKEKTKLVEVIKKDLKEANKLIKKEVIIKKYPKLNKTPLITPKLTKKIKVNIKFTDLSKYQNILDNTNYNKKTFKSISQIANKYNHIISREKLKKPIIDIINNRIITHRNIIKPKKIKSLGNGKISRKLKKEQKKVLTEKEILKQIKKQQPKATKVKLLEIKEIVETLEKPLKPKKNSLLLNKKGNLNNVGLKLIEKDIKISKNKYLKTKNKYKKSKITRNKIKLSTKKIKQNKKLNQKKLLKEYQEQFKKIDKKVKALEKIIEKEPKLRENFRKLLNIKFALKKDISFILEQLKVQDKVQEKKKDNKQDQKKAQDKIQEKKKDNKQNQKLREDYKFESKNIKLLSQKRKYKTQKIKPKEIKVEDKLKFKKLISKSKLPKGYTYAYDAKIKIKGKVKTIKLGLPTNRALNKVGKLIDNTTSRSMQLVPVGIIKKTKDITKPSVLGKFRVRKGKKALILVEKSKHTIDTSGEKRGLSIGKLLSPKKKTKKVVKKKIIKKSFFKVKKKMSKTITPLKKSSKNGYKKPKSSKVAKTKSKRKNKGAFFSFRI